MEITDVQITLCDENAERLRAFCAVVFDNSFVVHNVRVIEKSDGFLVAMPSRKLTAKCRRCGFKNPIDGHFCTNCGTRLNDRETSQRIQRDTKIHFDVAHPINPAFRQRLEQAVLEAFRTAMAKEPKESADNALGSR